VITRFDVSLIEFGDGAARPSQSVIGGDEAASGGIVIEIDDVHSGHDQQRRQR
jgi:hypothetical protein